ncbi:DUF2330 domain-containing protein [Mycolicibacterium stellerae]|uniref:DUF2330 domain-containing protein n=1 Tax=Mycolicibacterium stellerae TaxID=2358193 RepID=UPI000F0B9716|nr:DUF2330 domain-containing protein [Mycolicibacterium stellerae]
MFRVCRAVGVVVVLVLAGLSTGIAAPAWACGCGAYIPSQQGASVVDERALIAWDGSREDILMALRVTGSSDSAAWVMPVPSAAQVSLGEAEAFTELGRLTAPRIEYRDSWWPTFDWLTAGGPSEGALAGSPPGAGVNVLDHQRIGPFDVTRLAAHDATALAKWLTDNGFPQPDGIDANLAPYVADQWETVAVKLAPAADGESLTGDLQPLRLSFASDRVIYPMRLSRSASTPQTVDLYVLAEHRMDPTSLPVTGNAPTLEFAGRIEGTDVSPALADFVSDGAFLTRWNNVILEPEMIDGDYIFAQADADTAYQRVVYRTRNRGDLTGLTLLVLVGCFGIGLTVLLVRRSANRGGLAS